MKQLNQIIVSKVPASRIELAITSLKSNPLEKGYNIKIGKNRLDFILPIIDLIYENHLSQSKAVTKYLADILNKPTHAMISVAKLVSVKNRSVPDDKTIMRWLKKYREEGIDGLTPKRIGKQASAATDWKKITLQLFNLPGKPKMSSVHRKLVEDYNFKISYEQVKRFLKNVPAEVGAWSPYRIGPRLHHNTQSSQYLRTTENLAVGHIYTGDGHTIDLYFKHPATGDIFRVELVVWMDVRSRYIVGWSLETSEHAYGTINALSKALDTHNHSPVNVHIDNGSGYASKIMNAENTGFYDRLGIKPIYQIPGAPTGKGIVERWFRTMEEDLNIYFGPAFCGSNHSKDHLREFVNKCKIGKAEPVDLRSWCAQFEAWLVKYHNRSHPEVKNSTPAELWATLANTPTHIGLSQMRRPQVQRKVIRGDVKLNNRVYRHPTLLSLNAKDVVVEYDFHTDKTVAIYYKQALYCMADLYHKNDYLPESIRVEQKQKSLEMAEQRLQKKITETRARAGILEDGGSVIDNSSLLIDVAADEPEQPLITLDLNDI